MAYTEREIDRERETTMLSYFCPPKHSRDHQTTLAMILAEKFIVMYSLKMTCDAHVQFLICHNVHVLIAL